jgi:PST family polysaccharide transporter
MLKFAFSTYGTWCLGYMGKSIDKILIGRFLGSQPLGHYDRAYHLSLMLPNQLVSPLTNVAMATLSRLSQDEEKLRSTYLSILSTIAFVGVPLSAVLTLVGKDLIVLLLGSHWQKAGELFTAFGFSIAVFMLYMTHGWIHLSLGTPHRWLKWSVIALMVKASFIIGGLQFGITGVAIAYTASYYLLMGPGLIYAGMPMGLRLYHILAVTWRYFVAGLVSGLLSWIVVSHVDDRFGVFVQMTTRTTLSLVLSLSTYLLMVILLYGSVRPIMRLFDIMREMIPRRSGLL